jgi:hypothetical protein
MRPMLQPMRWNYRANVAFGARTYKSEENAMRSMRSMLLTTVAAAAVGALPFPAHAQDRKQQSPAALESNQPPESQQKGMRENGLQPEKAMQPERSGRSAAEANQPGTEVHGKNQNRNTQEDLKSKNNTSEAQPAQGAEPEKGSMRKPSASTEPAQPGQAKKQRQGEATPPAAGAEHPTRHTMRSNAPNTPEQQNERMPAGTMTRGNETPNEMATGRSGVEGGAMPAQGNVQQQGAAVRLNSHQRTRVVDALRNENVQRLDRADFALAVGTAIPAYVALNPLPESIVEIVPQYRGYDFVMVRDEIIIVEPRTRHIVTVLRGEGRSVATAEQGQTVGHVRLTHHQRRLIRHDLFTSESESVPLESVWIGERLPADISLLPIPEDVLDQIPTIGQYRYVVTGNDVVLVAPDTREVVAIID